ncbi:hypothetical protein SAMN04487833_1486 [Sarcina sp. DSM 11001]|uniref:hypothetical protein n=1 Tax=Sarcina sp. DSM 11001 TaxID=1798184 RepID=UPI00087E64A9|nr:hypothetical protein [Sarcina sp. DSM 11001]SDM00903.1 hypothetical protein SAMN04487833_1486 [Sarcina sp. DSM 11001]
MVPGTKCKWSGYSLKYKQKEVPKMLKNHRFICCQMLLVLLLSLFVLKAYATETKLKPAQILYTGNIAGILLYAKTDEAITSDCMFNMGGNKIGAKTLDLNVDFKVIAAQLDIIAQDFFECGQKVV